MSMNELDQYIEQKVEIMMEQYRQELIARCEAGMQGQASAEIKEINIALTNKCNCCCIMCPCVTEETKQTGILNEVGHMVTLSEFKNMLADKIGEPSDKELIFSFMSGETFLNPDIYEIVKYIKTQYKNSRVIILSNGTIPPKNPEIVKYIDILSFSLDGAEPEVYEKIRTPAKFEHMTKTVKKWVQAAALYHPDIYFDTSTTLSTLNFHTLPDIVKMVGEFAREEGLNWGGVYCQPIVIESYQAEWLKEITLEHIDKKTGKAVLDETTKVAKEYGIYLNIMESIYRYFEDEQEEYTENVAKMQRFCKKLESGILAYNGEGEQKFACCFMDKNYYMSILSDYGIDLNGAAEEVYNSKGYWQMRKDLLEGKLGWICRDCMIGCADYYTARSQIKKIVLMDELQRLKTEQ